MDYKFMAFIWQEDILWSLTKKTAHGGLMFAKLSKEEHKFSSIKIGNE